MDTIAEFQARRTEVWRRVRPSIIAMLVSFGVLFVFCDSVLPEPTRRFWLCFLAMLVVAGAIVHITVVWKRLYRCPACETPIMNPMSRGGDVPLNPRSCPNCGAQLG